MEGWIIAYGLSDNSEADRTHEELLLEISSNAVSVKCAMLPLNPNLFWICADVY